MAIGLLTAGVDTADESGSFAQDVADTVNAVYEAVDVFRLIQKPEILRGFTDTTGVVVTNSGGNTSTVAIDAASPFGGSALRVDLTATAGFIEVGVTGLNVTNFDGNVVFKVWIQDYTKVGQITCNAGTSAYSRFYQQVYNLTSSNLLYNGSRCFAVGELHKAQSGTFVKGVDTLNDVKIRFNTSTAANSVWIQAILMPRKNKGVMMLTYDDGFAIWKSRVIPKLNQYGLKAGLAIEQSRTNTANNLTSQDLLEFSQQGHLLAPHQVTNTRFDDLNDATGQALTPYMADFTTSVNSLRGWTQGIGTSQYNAYVQGRFNETLINALKGRGLRVGRGVLNSYDHYSCGLGAELFALKAAYLDQVGVSVAAIKERIDNCAKYGTLLTLMGHDFSTNGVSGPSLWPIEWHDEVIDYVAQKVEQGEIIVMRPDDLALIEYMNN